VLIFAGSSPFTLEQELKGSRNEFIQWIQDVHDQREIMRGYTNYTNEFRTGKNIKQVTLRALQFATSDPKGPVYLVGPREVMEEEVEPLPMDMSVWTPVNPCALPPFGVKDIVNALLTAKHPLVVTSYLGKNPKAVGRLVELVDRLAIAVHESCPSAMNFPASHPAHQGCQWNGGGQSLALAEADVVLVIDSDVPWIPRESNPMNGAKIFHLDVDVLKEQMPLFYIPAQNRYKTDAETALTQILEGLEGKEIDTEGVKKRLQYLSQRHKQRIERLDKDEIVPSDGSITTPVIMGFFRKLLPKRSIFMIEVAFGYSMLIAGHYSVRTMFRPLPLGSPWTSIRFWCGESRMGTRRLYRSSSGTE
jgi:acetolactate synthase I/II/III large subunit